MKKFLWIAGLVIIIAIMAAAYSKRAANGSHIKIGAALGLTGECANYGEGELKATELAVAEANLSGGINGRQLDLSVEDTQCDPKGSVNAMQKLVQVDGVQAVVGLTWGDSYQAGYTVNNPAKIVSVAPSAALEALIYNHAPLDFVFSTWFPEKAEIDALQARAKKMNLTKFVIAHDVDTFGAMMANLFETRAGQNGLSIIKDYQMPIGAGDYRTIIAEMKGLNPPAVALFFQTPAAKAEFLKQAKELGLNAQGFTDASIEDPSLLNNFKGAMEGLIYTYPQVTGDNQAFMQKFKAYYGKDSVGASDPNAYDATRVIITALEEHYKNDTDMLTAVQNIDIPGTAVKEIKFDNSHQITGAQFEIKTVRNGQFVISNE